MTTKSQAEDGAAGVDALVNYWKWQMRKWKNARPTSERETHITQIRRTIEVLESQKAARVEGDDANAIEQAVEAEQIRWQQRLNFVHVKYDVDGSGTDSGDPLDLTEAEITIALGQLEERIEELTAQSPTEPTAAGQRKAAIKECIAVCKKFSEQIVNETAGRAALAVADELNALLAAQPAADGAKT